MKKQVKTPTVFELTAGWNTRVVAENMVISERVDDTSVGSSRVSRLSSL